MPIFGPVASSGAINGELLMTHGAVCLGWRQPVTMADLAVRARYTGTMQEPIQPSVMACSQRGQGSIAWLRLISGRVSMSCPVCQAPVRLGRLVCAEHLDETNIAAQLRRDRGCPDCDSLRRSGCCCTSAAPRRKGATEPPRFGIGRSIDGDRGRTLSYPWHSRA